VISNNFLAAAGTHENESGDKLAMQATTQAPGTQPQQTRTDQSLVREYCIGGSAFVIVAPPTVGTLRSGQQKLTTFWRGIPQKRQSKMVTCSYYGVG